MPARVRIAVLDGPMRGKSFVFDEHDALVFGREADCHCCLPKDKAVSRHHFLLEVNPPSARVRDLGSANGTFVNGKRHGGRGRGETLETAAGRRFPEVELRDGDEIAVGRTRLLLRAELPIACGACGAEVPEADLPAVELSVEGEEAEDPEGGVRCLACRATAGGGSARGAGPVVPRAVPCARCGRTFAPDAAVPTPGSPLCRECVSRPDTADFVSDVRRLLESPPQPGEPTPVIAGFELLRRIGSGGCGVVYEGLRRADGRRVAVKVMLAQSATDPDRRKRFLREIEVTRALRHPNVVELLEHGAAGDAFFFVMEYCDAGSAEDLQRAGGGRLRPEVAVPLVMQALAGLAYAHEFPPPAGPFVHRDVKPQNLLLAKAAGAEADRGWVAKVGDFGLAKNFERAGLSGMTLTGNAAGSRGFMPVEQITNFRFVKPISDVWSMGATLYYLLTGQYPFDFPADRDPLEVILGAEVRPVRDREPSLPPGLAAVIDRSLSKSLKARYATARAFGDALGTALG
ncbi:MAG: protein kinase [Planctomycetes bacterium]|nr:protein kinase [Planctomycetota bacterium]